MQEVVTFEDVGRPISKSTSRQITACTKGRVLIVGNIFRRDALPKSCPSTKTIKFKKVKFKCPH